MSVPVFGMGGLYGAVSPPETVVNEVPVKPNGVPWAHIHSGGFYAYCNPHLPILSTKDFYFSDGDYAAKFYSRDNKYLQACQACLDAYAKSR